MTFSEITEKILSFPNCTMNCDYFLIQNVHEFVQNQIEIVRNSANPKKECLRNKRDCLMVLNELENGNFIELNDKFLNKQT